jgi:hypothetical protein
MPVRDDDERRADGWAQKVVDAWGVDVQAGNAALLTDEFRALLDLACRYRDARSTADNHREFNMLSDHDEAEERRTRRAFVEAYTALHERHGQVP